jgi:hypothetical protein
VTRAPTDFHTLLVSERVRVLTQTPSAVGESPAAHGDQEPTMAVLGRIWAEMLKLTEVSGEDDFFELGGHSLLVHTVAGEGRSAAGSSVAGDRRARVPNAA